MPNAVLPTSRGLLSLGYFTSFLNCISYSVSNESMTGSDELRTTWKEGMVAYFEVLSQHSCRDSRKTGEQLKKLTPRPRIDPRTSRLRSRSANDVIASFCCIQNTPQLWCQVIAAIFQASRSYLPIKFRYFRIQGSSSFANTTQRQRVDV